MTVPVQRASARFVTQGDGWTGLYCFSYDEHYDPANTSFGRVLACNEFVLEPGAGFGLHRHGGLDIATTVLEGTLTHVGPEGVEQRGPGSYLLRTGAGIEHDERNDGDEPVRFVQAWFVPGPDDPRPAVHESGPVRLTAPAFVLVVEGEATLADVSLAAGDSVRLSGDAELHPRSGRVLVWDC